MDGWRGQKQPVTPAIKIQLKEQLTEQQFPGQIDAPGYLTVLKWRKDHFCHFINIWHIFNSGELSLLTHTLHSSAGD